MAATRRRMGLAGATGAIGVLVMAVPAPAAAGTAPPSAPAAPHGQLLQAPDGTLYLMAAGQAHAITPTPLSDEALTALTPGAALPDGAFWLVPTTAWGVAPQPAAPSSAPFFATQSAVAPRSVSSQRAAATVAPAPAQAARPRPAAPTAIPALPSATERPLGQS